MDVVIYRAKTKNGYIYNYSLCPEIDYKYLEKYENISEMEVMTPYLPLYLGKFAVRIINSSINKNYLINRLKDAMAVKVLKRLNIEIVSRKITKGKSISRQDFLEELLVIIGEKVITLDDLNQKIVGKITKEELYEMLQLLYLKNKIKFNPLYCKEGKSEQCKKCGKKCEDCFLGYSSSEILIYKTEVQHKKKKLYLNYKEEYVTKAIKRYVDEIGYFINVKKDNLVVQCPPMLRDELLTYKLLFEAIKSSEKILYVTCDNNIGKIKTRIERAVQGSKVHIFDGSKTFEEYDIVLCKCSNIPAFKDDFGVAILDDRLSFLENPYNNIFSVCKRALKPTGKFVNITVAPLDFKREYLKGSNYEIKIPPYNIWNPVPEPKFILSRYIGQRTVYLPDISLEMVKWSLEEESKVIIFTPSNRISIYLKNYLLKTDDIKASIGISSDKTREDYYSFLNGKKDILITSNFTDALDSIYNINVIVMYSDFERYTEDALLYMCSMANNHTKKCFREILFISNTEAENMLRAKSMVRSINKVAWENGYIKK